MIVYLYLPFKSFTYDGFLFGGGPHSEGGQTYLGLERGVVPSEITFYSEEIEFTSPSLISDFPLMAQ